jgi:uncharacterized protein
MPVMSVIIVIASLSSLPVKGLEAQSSSNLVDVKWSFDPVKAEWSWSGKRRSPMHVARASSPNRVRPGKLPLHDATRPANGHRPIRAMHTKPESNPAHVSEINAVNSGAVGVMSEGASDHCMRMVADLASVLDDGHKLRIVGLIGKGTAQNLRDLRFLQGVDVALVHSDALDIAKNLHESEDITGRVSYIARLQDEEMHVLANNEITDIHQLTGKKVNTSVAGGGGAASSVNVLDRLGIHAELLNYPDWLAEEKLKSGEIDAVVFWDSIPNDSVRNFKNDGRFHLVPVPYEASLQSVYHPASVPADTYPGLVPAGQKLETISLNALIAAYNWPPGSDRSRRVAQFAEVFLSKFSDLRKAGRDRIWQSIDPVGIAQGWPRLPAAQQWIDTHITHAVVPSPTSSDPTLAEFQTFLKKAPKSAGVRDSADAEKLFEEFLAWRKTKTKSP